MSQPAGRYIATSLGFFATLLLAAMPALDAGAGQSPAKGNRAARPTKPAPPPADDPAEPVADRQPAPRPGSLRMSRAVVCERIDGYEDYEPLPGAAQTSDEKLLIYYRPLRYKVDYVDGLYRAHLVQDNEIRKRGRKEVVRQKRKVVEYQVKRKEPLGPIYIRNTISLKGLQPGDYDLTIILRDELDKDAPPTRQVVKFKVTPPHDPRAHQDPGKSEGPPPEDPPGSGPERSSSDPFDRAQIPGRDGAE